MVSKFKAAIVAILVFMFLGCGKAAHADTKQLTLDNVEGSVYKVDMYESGKLKGSGTAFKFATNSFLTAGHVCEADKVRLIKSNGQEYPVELMDKVYDDELDFCFLYAPGVPGDPLPVVLDFPTKGDQVMWEGATIGIWGAADPADFDATPGGYARYIGGEYVIAPGSGPGASGSPIFTKDGVFGMLIEHGRQVELAKFQSMLEIYLFLIGG